MFVRMFASGGTNVVLLSLAQALLTTSNVIIFTLSGLVGYSLAPDPALSTVPVAAWVIGAACSTWFASLSMRRIGRRAGFIAGALFGVGGGLLCALAVWQQDFWLLSAGAALVGVYNAYGQYYRFAIAEAVPASAKSRAISLVLAGGIIGGVIGPESAKLTKDLLAPLTFLGSFLALGAFNLLALLVVSFVRIPKLSEAERRETGRPLAEIVRQPRFLVAALAAFTGYVVMNVVMVATPIAMLQCGLPFDDTAFAMEWHVIGMFAPAFVTGWLIARIGVLNVLLAGAALMVACVAFAVTGTAVFNFWMAVVLVGVGWNLLFVGGTTLLTECCTPAEQAKTQGLNDFVIFTGMAISTFGSGGLLQTLGWNAVNWGALPLVALTAAATIWLALRRDAPQKALSGSLR